jgi:hypothetical protein
MVQLCFYVSETHIDIVKEAVFSAGAGRIGNYEHCAWQVLGQGQFKPIAGSTPYLGSQGQRETIPEFRVEMVCDDSRIKAVIDALIESHPYEEPAFQYWQINEVL